MPRAHLLRVHALQKSIPAFSDALTLLKVWANQRGYGEGEKLCVRGFEGKGIWWAAVLDLLVNGEERAAGKLSKAASKRKPLGKGLSSYQLFRAALDFFGECLPARTRVCILMVEPAKHDYSREHIFLKTENGHRVCHFLPAMIPLTILTVIGVSFRLMSMTDMSPCSWTILRRSIYWLACR